MAGLQGAGEMPQVGIRYCLNCRKNKSSPSGLDEPATLTKPASAQAKSSASSCHYLCLLKRIINLLFHRDLWLGFQIFYFCIYGYSHAREDNGMSRKFVQRFPGNDIRIQEVLVSIPPMQLYSTKM